MFEELAFQDTRNRRKWTILAALGLQVAAIGVMLALPYVTVEPLPMASLNPMLLAPPAPPPPPPPAAPASAPHRVAEVMPTHRFDPSKLYEPKVVPKNVPTIADAPTDLPSGPVVGGVPGGVPGGVAGGVPGGVVGGTLGGILGGVPSMAPPPPPPPPAAPAPKPTPSIITVGGAVQAAQVLSAPAPAYPVLAKQARIQGAVKLNAIIGADGHIENLNLVSGNPLLAPAAMSAVKSWTYRPTYLNGKAVKVATEIVVTFTLG